jgi:hypothetical protein
VYFGLGGCGGFWDTSKTWTLGFVFNGVTRLDIGAFVGWTILGCPLFEPLLGFTLEKALLPGPVQNCRLDVELSLKTDTNDVTCVSRDIDDPIVLLRVEFEG